jgi:hypothetical protein
MAVAITRRLPLGVTELPAIPPSHFKGGSVSVRNESEREAQGILALRGKKHTAQVRRDRHFGTSCVGHYCRAVANFNWRARVKILTPPSPSFLCPSLAWPSLCSLRTALSPSTRPQLRASVTSTAAGSRWVRSILWSRGSIAPQWRQCSFPRVAAGLRGQRLRPPRALSRGGGRVGSPKQATWNSQRPFLQRLRERKISLVADRRVTRPPGAAAAARRRQQFQATSCVSRLGNSSLRRPRPCIRESAEPQLRGSRDRVRRTSLASRLRSRP